MATKRIYIVCYDISDDSRRNVIASVLEARGVRVQESVFEVRATHTSIISLGEMLKQKTRPGDRIRIYPLPLQLLKHCIAFGGAPIAETQEFFLL